MCTAVGPVALGEKKLGEYFPFTGTKIMTITPRRLEKIAQRVAERGWRYAEESAVYTTEVVEVRGEASFDETLSRANFRLARGHPWLDILSAFFWISASIRAKQIQERPDVPWQHGGFFGALSQYRLTRAFARISVEGRKEVFDIKNDLVQRTKTSEWLHHYRGAMSVVRVAHALCALQVHPVITTSEIDMHCKVDLITKLPAERTAKFLCLQIKWNGRKRPSCVNMVEIEPPRSGRWLDSDKLQRGMMNLMDLTGWNDFAAAMVYVGGDGERFAPWEVGVVTGLQSELETCLRRAAA